ncbi:DMT family transporter [Dapis sp. BLCC M229]|uniref:DMT family transporter n=1 Tax=Dapis sp. BLCC M229 TaxID=3400188 RepID=UPI003CF63C96
MSESSSQQSVIYPYKGFIMVIVGAALWGLSGTVAQELFQNEGFTPSWLVTIRLLISGFLLLLSRYFRKSPHGIWDVWNSVDLIQLLIFGCLGMLGVQYTYFAAIQTGNAATATILQYMGPLFIAVYLIARYQRIPRVTELIAMGLALFGILLLVTNGSIDKLSISWIALLWGLGSGIALAFYTLYPSDLLKRWDSDLIVGWGMTIGGLGLSLINPPLKIQGQHWSVITGFFVAFVIIFGTLIAFYLYIDSLRYITPTEASLLASAEPLSATITSVIWLHIPFGIFEAIGGMFIVGAVAVLLLLRSDE